MEEKRQRKEQEKYEDMLYAQQTQELNRMRGMLEDNFQQTKKNILNSHVDTNKNLDLERKEKEAADKEAHLQYQKDEVEYLKQRGVKQGFHMEVKWFFTKHIL